MLSIVDSEGEVLAGIDEALLNWCFRTVIANCTVRCSTLTRLNGGVANSHIVDLEDKRDQIDKVMTNIWGGGLMDNVN